MNNDDKRPNKQVKAWRKVVYIIGNILIVVGFILFFSGFLGFFNFSVFEPSFSNGKLAGPGLLFGFMKGPVFGFICILLGTFLKSLGREGFAGAGVILDPEKERRDLEPFSRSKGGKYADTYDEFRKEADFDKDLEKFSNNQDERIMVRCPNCKTLNDEDARFCKSCGTKLD